MEPIRVGSFWNNNYIKYEINSTRNRKPLVKEYLNEIKCYFKYIITNLQKSTTWRTIAQLTIPINSVSSKDTDKEQIMHSKSDNIEVVTCF